MCITITLVVPAGAEDTEAAARTMKTMGLSELWIVDSQAHPEPVTRWVVHGSGDIIDNIKVFPTPVESLHDVDFTVTTTTHSRVKYHHCTTSAELVPLLEERSSRMSHAALALSHEDFGPTNEELVLADVLTGMPMVADYPSFSLGQTMMVCCY